MKGDGRYSPEERFVPIVEYGNEAVNWHLPLWNRGKRAAVAEAKGGGATGRGGFPARLRSGFPRAPQARSGPSGQWRQIFQAQGDAAEAEVSAPRVGDEGERQRLAGAEQRRLSADVE